MTPDDRCMVDTNVLVYGTVAGNPWHEQARHWLMTLHTRGTVLCVSPPTCKISTSVKLF
jgi:predicted nucleic acid-binding protein